MHMNVKWKKKLKQKKKIPEDEVKYLQCTCFRNESIVYFISKQSTIWEMTKVNNNITIKDKYFKIYISY